MSKLSLKVYVIWNYAKMRKQRPFRITKRKAISTRNSSQKFSFQRWL